METSAAFASSHLFPSFSDHSHLDFYQRRTVSLPSVSPRPPPLRSSSSNVDRLRAVCCLSLCASPLLDPPSQQSSLLKELAELKQQIKQKKKDLKAQKKDEKRKMKMHLKEERKATKQKDGVVGKKKKCESESSSSSESSDEDCNSVSMRMLREELPSPCISAVAVSTSAVEDVSVSSIEKCCDQVSPVSMADAKVVSHARAAFQIAESINRVCCDEKADSVRNEIILQQERVGLPPQRAGPKFPVSVAPNRIEVCAGGKCKKAGAEQLLSTLSMQIPSSSDVVAVPCKCMGKCSMTMNVKVHREDTNPQHHSHVRMEDANFLLNHHYGLGRPPSGLPSLPSHDATRLPSVRTVS